MIQLKLNILHFILNLLSNILLMFQTKYRSWITLVLQTSIKPQLHLVQELRSTRQVGYNSIIQVYLKLYPNQLLFCLFWALIPLCVILNMLKPGIITILTFIKEKNEFHWFCCFWLLALILNTLKSGWSCNSNIFLTKRMILVFQWFCCLQHPTKYM